MANTMTKDRDYYRALSTEALREEVQYAINPNWKELAIALDERLETIRREVYDEVSKDTSYDGAWNYCPDCGYELK